MKAPRKRSSVDTSNTGPMTINIIEGGIKIPSVPPAVIVPAANFTSYPARDIVAPAMIPSIVTEAPTIPVAAAKIVDTIKTAINKAPLTRDMII